MEESKNEKATQETASASSEGEPAVSALNYTNDGDEAIRVFEALGGEKVEMDAATNKRLLRRIDFVIMPILCIVYGLNYLDKTTLSYASITGLIKDIGLKGDNYSWLGSVFYIGYLAWEFPAGRMMQRLPLAKYNGVNIILWGAVLCFFALVDSFAGAVAVRFLLGVLEASVTLGFALITSQWYTKKEQANRIAIWVSFNGFAQIFGGCVAYGIAQGGEKHGYTLTAWKIIFVLTGLMTVVMGISSRAACPCSVLEALVSGIEKLTYLKIFLIVVPDSQLNARWLSPRDRALAVERVRENQQGIGNNKFKIHQFKEALMDPITWIFFVLAVAGDLTNGGLSNFFSQLIVSFGFTPEQSLLYGTPAGAVEIIALLSWGYMSQRWGYRVLLSTGGVAASMIGVILIVALPLDNKIGRLIGYYLTTAFVIGFIAMLSLVSSNIAGYTKKTTVGAILLVGYSVGNIIGPQTFRPKDKPRYVSAEITIIAMYALEIAGLVLIHFYYRQQNKKKAAVRASPGYKKLENQQWLDLTDWENPEFVYEL